jgi:sec-independent protein translocase protein TatC
MLSPDVTPEPEGQRLSLAQHLGELRSRLLRCTLAVLVLGILGLVFARPIFGALMRPVLDALPPGQRSLIYTSGIEELNVLMKVGLYAGIFLSTPVILWQLWGFVSPGLYPAERSLIYTSGIEELNVLMKVGLYAGIFLATPVLLAQIWGFVAPGLYPRERKYAFPFVLLGTMAFLIGATFCYLVVLPTMFRFLLSSGDTGPIKARVERARAVEQEALRFVRSGDFARAANLGDGEVQRLTALGDGRVSSPGRDADGVVELQARLDAQGRLVDATRDGLGLASAPALRQALEKRFEAVEAFQAGALGKSSEALEQSASLLAGAAGSQGTDVARVWKMQKTLAAGQSSLAEEAWTRPLLTMSEQLSLVLMLLLALGVVFELPLVIALLAALGLVQSKVLFKYQRHAIVVCLILAAVITPTGDPINMAILAGPMLLCYEIGVAAAWFIEKRRARNASETALTPT